MAEDHKIDPQSLPGLLVLVREEQLGVHRKLSELIERLDSLEHDVKRLKEVEHSKSDDDHSISTG